MGNDAITLEAFNLEEFQQVLEAVPREAFSFIRREHKLLARRARKGFIRERMSGPPGINWGHGRNAKKVGGNVLAVQKDKGTIDSMLIWFRISSFLAAHEHGHTFTAKSGGNLAIPLSGTRTRDGRLPYKPSGVRGIYEYGQRPFRIPNTNILAVSVNGKLIPLYSLHRSIRIPARLGFLAFMRGQLPEFKARTEDALRRAFKVAIERRVKSIARSVSTFSA